jgi:comEA protein
LYATPTFQDGRYGKPGATGSFTNVSPHWAHQLSTLRELDEIEGGCGPIRVIRVDLSVARCLRYAFCAATARTVSKDTQPWSRIQEGVMNVIWNAVAVGALAGMLAVGGATLAGAADGNRVDINSASVAELTSLPGIGPAKAAAIVEQRERVPFKSVADLTRVSGIGERTLEDLRDRISVGEVEGKSGATRK